MTTLIEVRDLSKSFSVRGAGARSVPVVAGVSFDLRAGETLGLVGESGSGKSTVGQCLIRLHRPDSGRILLDGIDMARLSASELRARRSAIQMIFQDPSSALNPRMTTGNALREALRTRHPKEGRRMIEDRLQALLSLIGLRPDHADRYPHQLSGGQKQRIGIARAIALEPRCLIADEAVSALDVSIQAQIITLLAELKAKLGLTMIFISHDLGVVRYVAVRVAVLYLGRLVEIGPAKRLFTHPRHPYTQALLSAIPDPLRPLDEARLIDEPGGPGPRLQEGCIFAARCRHATDLCWSAQPPLSAVAPDHASACIRQEIFAPSAEVTA